ncbi:hypothetical protein PR202_ga03803 [Eleusine coracana subsp. coracana]|uniref:Solute carrier family 40 protein n=1 Tax=Eleusine coracana subsp. coracana TaxID=191504 RepID=A0AAV5BN92_ELECO|nr:hypothetical protein PR202_ga03803 [Eleusine coracana subsp. coracana]
MWESVVLTLVGTARNNISKVIRAYAFNQVWISRFLMDLCGAVLMLTTLSQAPVSIVQPIAGCGLAILCVFSHFYLKEFFRTQDMLLLKESSEQNDANISTATTLISASVGSCPGGAAYALATFCAPSSSSKRGRGKGKGKSKGNGNSHGGDFYSNPSRPPVQAPSGPTPRPVHEST